MVILTAGVELMAELTNESTSHVVDIGWTKIGYNEAGSGEVPLILLHGAGAGATSWSNFVLNIPVFAEQHRVLAVDQPGYGKSDPYVMKESRNTVNARAVKDLMDALGIERANLVGNSMGGGTSLAFAVDYPDRIEKMVLMGSGGGGPALFTTAPTEGAKALQAVYYETTFEKFRAFFDVMLYDGKSVPDEVLRQRAAGVSQPHLDAWKESVGLAPQRGLVNELPSVKTPALIIHGRNDRVVPLEASLSLLSMLQNSQLHVFNRCGHWVQYEVAEEFNKMVLDFVSKT
jgi:2-hydroxy-6-oxonona-2,4-dienedioate hydrolase/2,6-dioxo-6-phenylhexa-3-enoate hydrolase